MKKRIVYLVVFCILILTGLAGFFAYSRPFNLGLDLQGGVHLIYEADLTEVEDRDRRTVMEGLRDVIERRIDFIGVKEPLIQVQEADGRYRLIVELAGVIGADEAIAMIGETPLLEFKEPLPTETRDKILFQTLGEDIAGMINGETACQNINFLTSFLIDHQQDPCFKRTELTGKHLQRASVGVGQALAEPVVDIEFNEEGAKIFEDLTSRLIGQTLAIYIDGLPISLPVVRGVIAGGRGQIDGRFTTEEARTLARNLNAGALPVPIELIYQQTVGPTLGAISLEKSLQAGIIGLLAILLFIIVFYKIPGILASLSLIVYIILSMAFFQLIAITWTLAGIGGLLLSIGMALDINILIFARIREELKQGRNLKISIEEGFKRAWFSVRDSKATTLIIGLILFSFGTSFVRGFALTLSVGILISMFVGLIITKIFLRCFVETRWEKYNWLWR